jgi:hypothetical protein
MQPTFTDNDVRVIEFPETAVGILTRQGDPKTIGDTIRRFIEWSFACGSRDHRARKLSPRPLRRNGSQNLTE